MTEPIRKNIDYSYNADPSDTEDSKIPVKYLPHLKWLINILLFIFIFSLCLVVIESFFWYITPPVYYKLVQPKAPVKYDALAGYVINNDGIYERQFIFTDEKEPLSSTATLKDGMRFTPVSIEGRNRFALFFGDSFTFGVGVDDNETLPVCFAEEMPEFMPYNFGIPGGSVQQMYLKFQKEEVTPKVKEKEGVAFYWFFGFHTRRAVGGMPAFNRWAEIMPCFELEEEQLVYKGNFRTAHPWRGFLYDQLFKSYTLRYINFCLPRSFTDYDYQLTTRLLWESYLLFKKSYPTSHFVVLLWDDRDSYLPVQQIMDQVGIPTVLAKTFFNGADNPLETGLTLPDGHLIEEGYRRVAHGLAGYTRANLFP